MKHRSGENRTAAVSRRVRADAPNLQRATDTLASQVMGWRMAPGRFVKSNRSWIPHWRFQPFNDTASAFELLHQAADRYNITCDTGAFEVAVHVGTRWGRASGDQLALTITYAVAEAAGVEISS